MVRMNFKEIRLNIKTYLICCSFTSNNFLVKGAHEVRSIAMNTVEFIVRFNDILFQPNDAPVALFLGDFKSRRIIRLRTLHLPEQQIFL